jgi:hypothetical protein
MWRRTLMRLLSLSFMSIFVIGLLWEEGRRPRETVGHKPLPSKPRDEELPPDL